MTTDVKFTPGVRAASVSANRSALLRVAREMFETRGYHDTTLRAIATAARLSTGALFSNWDSKEALYAEIYGHPPVTPETGRLLWSFLELKGHDPVNILRTVVQSEAA